MKLTIPRIVGLLAAVMILLFAGWEIAEGWVQKDNPSADLTYFYLARGISTALLMTGLTVLLITRYRHGYEEALRDRSDEAHRMRVFFENIVQDAADAIISLDNSGVIRTWNRAAERIYGYPAAEIVGRSFRGLVPPDLIASREPERILEAVNKNGFVRNYETRRIRKDGRTINVRITSSLLRDAEGEIVGSSAIVNDITAEKEMEARLIHAEKLAAIGQAAASTAHEVRNALAGIWGTIEVIEGTPAWRQLPEEVSNEVKLQMARIAHIIDDLLAYARPSRLALRRKNIHEVLDRVIASTSALPDARGKITIRNYADGDLPAEVDPARLEQAIQNLMANAYQAMEEGGRLEVVTCRGDGAIRIVFTDTGAGMTPETLSQALEPFFTTKARGTGLGLAIARSIVEAHGGRIDLRSRPGSGTTVALTLPAARSPHEPAASETSAA